MHPRLRMLALSAVAATAAALVGPAGPVAAAPSAAPPTPSVSPPAPVTLITGDVVRVGVGARPTVSVLPRVRTGAAGAFRTVRTGDSVRVIPAIAVPYLGRELDPALFDVTALAATGGRIPVRIAYRAGAPHRALPGITVTSTAGSTATGYLTPGSARRFGQALADQVRVDAAAGWHRDAGLFAGVGTIAWGGPATPVVQPRFPMFTLRIKVLDGTGAPADFAFLDVVNVDDLNKHLSFPIAEAGEARVSVPAGNYSLIADSPEFGADGSFTDRIVPVTDFAVTGPKTLPTIDMRTARVRPSVVLPRPAIEDLAVYDWTRGDVLGSTLSQSFIFDGTSTVLFAPGRPVVHGVLSWGEQYHFTAADGSYTDDLKYGADGAIPTRLRHVVTAGQLATLTVHYSSDVPGRQILSERFGFRGSDFFATAIDSPVVAPGTRTEYVGGSPDVVWQQQLVGVAIFDPDNFVIADLWSDATRSYQPGQRSTVTWARQPLHPSLPRNDALSPFPPVCAECRVGNELSVSVVSLADTDPGHVGFLDIDGTTPAGPITGGTRLRVFGGATLLSDEHDVIGTQVTVPAAGRRYRVLYEQHRAAPWIRLGTAATTEWGFASARPAVRTAPAGWICPDGDGECAVLPLLVPSYEVATDGQGRVAAGAGTVVVGFTATEGAPMSPVDQGTVSWSTDDGATWQVAPVHALGAGQFSAAVTNPAGGTVSLRVTGRDRAGNTITQTLVRAYAVR
jgi:hypothetical protein